MWKFQVIRGNFGTFSILNHNSKNNKNKLSTKILTRADNPSFDVSYAKICGFLLPWCKSVFRKTKKKEKNPCNINELFAENLRLYFWKRCFLGLVWNPNGKGTTKTWLSRSPFVYALFKNNRTATVRRWGLPFWKYLKISEFRTVPSVTIIITYLTLCISVTGSSALYARAGRVVQLLRGPRGNRPKSFCRVFPREDCATPHLPVTSRKTIIKSSQPR